MTVEGVPPDTYLERFAWNEAKYPPRRPLKETVAAITETAQKLEDELKARRADTAPDGLIREHSKAILVKGSNASPKAWARLQSAAYSSLPTSR